MSIDPTIFRAYDIRGTVEDALTEQACYQIGQAIGTQIILAHPNNTKQQSIAIGRDGRLSGPSLIESLKNGIISTGCQVIDVGMVPTPVLYFAVKELGLHSGAMLTGSHNPSNYNGIKMVINGETIFGEKIQALYQLIKNNNLIKANEAGKYTEHFGILDSYADAVCKDIVLKKPLKIVIDCGNGVAGTIAEKLFQRLGCDIIPLFTEVDGTFPNHHPDPSKLENVQDAIKHINAYNADCALAFDGDADRLGLITNTGEMIYADRQMMLFSEAILEKKQNIQIIYDVKCTKDLPDLITRSGGIPVMSKTGHSFIKAKLKETNAEFAGEMSGHLFFNDRWYGFDDGLYAGARFLELLSETDKTANQLFEVYPKKPTTPEIQIPVDESIKFQIIEQLQTQTDVFANGNICTLDGLRVDFEDSWGLLRASNTTPILVARFEGDTLEALDKIKQKFIKALKNVDQSITIDS